MLPMSAIRCMRMLQPCWWTCRQALLAIHCCHAWQSVRSRNSPNFLSCLHHMQHQDMEFDFLTPNAGQPTVKRAGLRPRARPVIMGFFYSACDTKGRCCAACHTSSLWHDKLTTGDLLCRGHAQPLQALCRQTGKQVNWLQERTTGPLSCCCDLNCHTGMARSRSRDLLHCCEAACL